MSTQEALVINQIASPLSKISRPIPIPSGTQILVKVTAAGLNPHDQKVRDIGLFLDGKLPAIIADDIAGTVEKLGPDVTEFKIGDRIFGQSLISDHLDAGGLQQYAILEQYTSARTPSSISDDEAATFPANIVAAVVALFHTDGLNLSAPFIPVAENVRSSDRPQRSHVVIIGGGSNTGKFCVQLAALAGIKDIIVVAGRSNEKELKSYGATHIIDRHGTDVEIKAGINSILDNNCLYVIDTVNKDHTIEISLLSSSKRGKAITLLRGTLDESKIGEKTAGYDLGHVLGSSHLKRELCEPFWKALPGLVDAKKIKPLGFQVVENGLDAGNVDRILDDYRDGKNPGKWHVHPN